MFLKSGRLILLTLERRKLPPRKSDSLIQNKTDAEVENDVGTVKANVTPDIVVTGLNSFEVLVSIAVLTVRTYCGIRWILQIPSSSLKEAAHVVTTCLSIWRGGVGKLLIFADNLSVMKERSHQVLNDVSVRTHSVHENPEAWHQVLGLNNTCKRNNKSVEERHQNSSRLNIRSKVKDHETKRDVEQLQEDSVCQVKHS